MLNCCQQYKWQLINHTTKNLKQSPHETLYGTIFKTIEIGPRANQTASTFAMKKKNNWATIGARITRAKQKVKKNLNAKKEHCHDQTRGQNIFINKEFDKLQIRYAIHWSIQNNKCEKRNG